MGFAIPQEISDRMPFSLSLSLPIAFLIFTQNRIRPQYHIKLHKTANPKYMNPRPEP